MHATSPAPPTGPMFSFAGFAHTPRTLALVWKSSRSLSVLYGLTTLVAAVLPLGIAWIGKRIIDAALARDPGQTVRNVMIELALVGGLALATQGRDLISQVLGARLSLDVNIAILEKAISLDLSHFEDPTFYDQLTRA
ncbi:MAG TPA: hypothetical protein VLM85_22535, partial [Polyangiaceae bacterium]|nr:hypothetical protein [Polyangiaceae bacterium]